MSDGVAPSKGALRAAQLVAAEYERARNFGRSASPSHEKLARIIDGEVEDLRTKAKQMEALLRDMVPDDEGRHNGLDNFKRLAVRAERLLSELEVKP